MTRRPHIILLLSDEHRGQAMSHAGDPNVSTPHMDRLAAEGKSFTRAYANSPICTPSRGTLFSGRHAHCGPVASFFDVYKASFPSLATELRKVGYHTSFFGKWHCGTVRDQIPPNVRNHPADYPGGSRNRTPEHFRGGFQDWLAFENLNQHFSVSAYRNHAVNPEKFSGYETDVMIDEAICYLKNYHADAPLFFTISVTPPHFPMAVPKKWLRHEPSELKVPSNFMKWKGCSSLSATNSEDSLASESKVRQMLATYYAMIENLDENLGRLKSTVDDLQQFRDNTLFIYLSDHGDFMGSHGWFFHKSQPHEESVRVPAIFHWPGHIPASGRVEGLFGLVDFLATTLGLAGLSIPEWNQGNNWSEFLLGDGPAPVNEQLLEIAGNPRWTLDHLDWRGFVTERWKYAFYESGEEVLFDLEKDPWEEQNLASIDAHRLPSMRAKLLQLLRDTREPSFDILMTHGVPPDQCIINVAPEEHPIFALPKERYLHYSKLSTGR